MGQPVLREVPPQVRRVQDIVVGPVGGLVVKAIAHGAVERELVAVDAEASAQNRPAISEQIEGKPETRLGVEKLRREAGARNPAVSGVPQQPGPGSRWAV